MNYLPQVLMVFLMTTVTMKTCTWSFFRLNMAKAAQSDLTSVFFLKAFSVELPSLYRHKCCRLFLPMFVLDLSCFSEAKYCYTRHTIDIEGDSVSVTKRCVALEDCLSTGCTEMDHEGNKVGSVENLYWQKIFLITYYQVLRYL